MFQAIALRRTVATTAAAGVLTVAMIGGFAAPAEAGSKKDAALAGAVGLATGLAIGSMAGGYPAYAAPPAYVPVGPGYYPVPPSYGNCHVKVVKKVNKWGNKVIIKEKVCY